MHQRLSGLTGDGSGTNARPHIIKPTMKVLTAALLAVQIAQSAPHPRLQINQPLIEQIRTLRDANHPAWARLEKWSRTARPNAQPGPYVLSNLMLHLVSNDDAAFQRASTYIAARIYTNKKDRTAGLVSLLDLYNGDHHKAAFIGGDFLGIVAHYYDWGFAKLTAEQKEDLAKWLIDGARFTALENKSARAFLRNDGASATFGLASAAYALSGDTPAAPQILTWFRSNWSETMKGFDIMGRGGALGEGNAYGTAPTALHIIAAANVAFYAAGEDLFLSHVWFRKRLLYDAFAAYPGTIGGRDAAVPYPNFPIIEQSSIGGDGRRALSWHSINLRSNGMILTRRFAGTDEANTWNWVYRQPAVDRMVNEDQAVYDLLYYSPKPKLEKPKQLSYYDPSMGYVFIRSDWDSPDATWIAMWAGPHIDTHQHLDQGAFVIFKRRDLAPKTGHYDNDNVKSSHHLAWYTRTVSSNGILIGDPKEVFRSFIAGMGCDSKGKGDRIPSPDNSEQLCIPNDGGQRTFTPKGMAVGNAASFAENPEIWDVARVVSFKDDGETVTVVADITNAYSSTRYAAPGNTAKVAKVYRRLVYLRPADLLLIADTVESTNASFEKKWLLHGLDRIEIPGAGEKLRAGETVYGNSATARVVVDDTDPSDKHQTSYDLRKGYAALLLRTLNPAPFRYRLIGGREPADTADADLYGSGKNADHFHRHVNDFWVKDFSEGVLPGHKSVNWAPAFPIESYAQEYIPTFNGGYGRWRIELEPATPNKTDYFLNVMKPTTDQAAALPAMEKLETATHFGAVIHAAGRDYRVLFPKETLDAPSIGK